jgi:thiol-disulfide isomerase/thioredoxin
MAAVQSTMLPLGTDLPAFELPEPGRGSVDTPMGRIVSSRELLEGSRGVLVMFLCNHCPYVKHLRGALADFGRRAQEKGLGVVAISSNDVEAYPADGPEEMARERAEAGWTFPYLFDATQEVAKAFRAACTPEFYLFDAEGALVYRGQFDGSRPGNDVPVTGADLEAAVDALLEGRTVPATQHPSVGCSIKWKPGNAP